METQFGHTDKARRTRVLIVASSVVVTALVIVGVLRFAPAAATRQEMVHDMGSQVMPFDLDKTTHVFKVTDTGGIQQVIARDPNDQQQIALIQQHLQHETMQFGLGNFSDPSTLHGSDMPGLKELEAGAGQVKVEYTALPNGAQLTYTTSDSQLIAALHKWFNAQLSDHGQDATNR